MKTLFLLNWIVVNAAWADAPGLGGKQGVAPFVPLIIIFGIFYFLILRPQQKKAKQQQVFLSALKKGDMVITNAGIIGTVKAVGEKIVTLEVDNGVAIKILRTQILESANTLKEESKAKAPLFAKPQEETK